MTHPSTILPEHGIAPQVAQGTAMPGRRAEIAEGLREALAVFVQASVFTLGYVALFTLERQLLAREIIFYDALTCLFVTTALLIFSWLAGLFRFLPGGSAAARRAPVTIMLAFAMSYAFAITVPALINRSISFFMITNVVESGDAGLTARELEQRFIDQYVIAYGAIPRRLEEQLETGNFEESAGRYHATGRGRITYRVQKGFLAAFRANEDFLGPRQAGAAHPGQRP